MVQLIFDLVLSNGLVSVMVWFCEMVTSRLLQAVSNQRMNSWLDPFSTPKGILEAVWIRPSLISTRILPIPTIPSTFCCASLYQPYWVLLSLASELFWLNSVTVTALCLPDKAEVASLLYQETSSTPHFYLAKKFLYIVWVYFYKCSE